MENAKLHEDAMAGERRRRDSNWPTSPAELPAAVVAAGRGYEFAAHYESALEVGGDYYGSCPCRAAGWRWPWGTWRGKGVPAALLMAKLSSTRASACSPNPTPARRSPS